VAEYQAAFEELFGSNLKRYVSLRVRIQKRVDQILADPYQATERLGRAKDGLDLRGCRSARVGRNYRIIFVICEECRRVPNCLYCFCEGRAAQTVVFLTVGPHDRAYAIK